MVEATNDRSQAYNEASNRIAEGIDSRTKALYQTKMEQNKETIDELNSKIKWATLAGNRDEMIQAKAEREKLMTGLYKDARTETEAQDVRDRAFVSSISSYEKMGISPSLAKFQMIDDLAKSDVASYSKMTSTLAGETRSGLITSTGNLTSSGASAIQIGASQQAHNILANNDMYSNRNNFFDMASNVGLDRKQMNSLVSAGSPTETANRFQAMTRSSSIKGTVGGRSFNLTAGADGAGWHGGFDSSVSFRGGYSASYGDPIAGALGSTMGIGGLQVAGAINSTMAGISSVTGIANRVGQVAGFAQRFTGGGGGGIAPTPTPTYSINNASLMQQSGSLTMNGGGMDGITMPAGSSISMPAQNSLYTNSLTDLPQMRFKMNSQNNSLFVTKHTNGGGRGGNGGMSGGGMNP